MGNISSTNSVDTSRINTRINNIYEGVHNVYNEFNGLLREIPRSVPSEFTVDHEPMESSTGRLVYKECVLFNVDIKKQDECSVCLSDFTEGDIACILPCWHIFHKECIDPWIETHNSCPNCRTDDRSINHLSKEHLERCKKEHKENIFFGSGYFVDLSLIQRLNVNKLKHILDEFNIDYSGCVEKEELRKLIMNKIFQCDKSIDYLKEYLDKQNIDYSDCLERSDLLKLVTLTKLVDRIS